MLVSKQGWYFSHEVPILKWLSENPALEQSR